MRRFAVIGLSTGLFFIVTSFALAAGKNQNVAEPHDTVPPAHKVEPVHQHTIGTRHDNDHKGEHHEGSDQNHMHRGFSFLRWFHEVIGRFTHPHVTSHIVQVTGKPHVSEPDHANGTPKPNEVNGLRPGGATTASANGQIHLPAHSPDL